MKNRKFFGVKRFTAVLLSILMLFSVVVLPTSAETINNIETSSDYVVYESHKQETTTLIANGNCGTNGDNVKWELYKDGYLYVYGNGDMANFDFNSAVAWRIYNDHVKSIIIEQGITRIGNYAFSSCSSGVCGATNITIPYGIKSIGYDAFYYCTGLTSIKIPNSVTSIENGAFYYCTGLTSIEIPNSVTSI